MSSNLLTLIQNQLNTKDAYTANGSKALRSTLNPHLDIFSKIGSLRTSSLAISNIAKWKNLAILDRYQNKLLDEFRINLNKSRINNLELLLKILLYTRDRINGNGERIIVKYSLYKLAAEILHPNTKLTTESEKTNKQLIFNTIKSLEEIGRWDDIIDILYDVDLLDKDAQRKLFQENTNIYIKELYQMIRKQFEEDQNSEYPSLLGKWLPSENTSKRLTKQKAKFVRTKILNLKSKDYRLILTSLRGKLKIIENNLRSKDYSFDYSKIPGKALLKYRQAFLRNDEDRYTNYIKELQSGNIKANTKVLTPIDIVSKIIRQNPEIVYYGYKKAFIEEKDPLLNELWYQLPNIFNNGQYINAIVAADVSSSMHSPNFIPISTAISLALYISQRNKGAFHNSFINFCGQSKLVTLPEKEKNIYDLCKYISDSFTDYSTNIESVMIDALLETAIKNNVPREEMPKYVIIISDMQFNQCNNCDQTNYQYWKESYKQAGYDLPIIVFWNVASSSSENISTAQYDDKVIFLSGSSQNNLKTIQLVDQLENIDEISLLPVYSMLETVKDYGKYLKIETLLD